MKPAQIGKKISGVLRFLLVVEKLFLFLIETVALRKTFVKLWCKLVS